MSTAIKKSKGYTLSNRIIIFIAFFIFDYIAYSLLGLTVGLGGGPTWMELIVQIVQVATFAGPLLLAIIPSKATLTVALLPVIGLIVIFLAELIEQF